MNNRLRRNADLRSFFFVWLFCDGAGSKDPRSWRRRSDNLEQKCEQAETPQIKNSSSDLELLNLTSFDGEVTSFTLERTSLMVDDTS